MNLSSSWELDALCAYARTGANIYYDHLAHTFAGAHAQGTAENGNPYGRRAWRRPLVWSDDEDEVVDGPRVRASSQTSASHRVSAQTRTRTHTHTDSRSQTGTEAASAETSPQRAPSVMSPTLSARMERSESAATAASGASDSARVHTGAPVREAPAARTTARDRDGLRGREVPPPAVPQSSPPAPLRPSGSVRSMSGSPRKAAPPAPARPGTASETAGKDGTMAAAASASSAVDATSNEARAVSPAVDVHTHRHAHDAAPSPVPVRSVGSMHARGGDSTDAGVRDVQREDAGSRAGTPPKAAAAQTAAPEKPVEAAPPAAAPPMMAEGLDVRRETDASHEPGQPPVAAVQPGMLSAVLRGGLEAAARGRSREEPRRSGASSTSTSVRERGPAAAAESAPSAAAAGVLSVKIYLPSKQAVKLRIPESATVGDVIAEVLRYARTSNVSPALAGDARCYELRLHDEDGEPDDDFPALDRTRKIRNFGQGSAHEYCLRAIPSAMAAYNAAQTATGATSAAASSTAPSSPALRSSTAPMPSSTTKIDDSSAKRHASGVSDAAMSRVVLGDGMAGTAVSTPASSMSSSGGVALAPPPSLRVVMQAPGNPSPVVTMVPFRDDLRVQDVIEYVAKRHRLPVFYERYVLKVTPVDQMRLNLPSRELPTALLVTPLALDTVEIVKKTYADSPPERRASAPMATAAGHRRHGSDVIVGRPSRMSAIYAEGAGKDGFGAVSSTPGGSGGSSTSGALTAAGTMAGTLGVGTLGGGAAGSVAVGTSVTSVGLARPLVQPGMGIGGLMHNAITAAQFQEWYVIKVNKRGRRQERLMGIDLTRITNRKVEKKRFVSDKTVNAERLISDIRRVEISDGNKTSFTIAFRETDSEDVALMYETRTAFEREEITSKLAFILNMNGQGYRIVRVP